MLNFILALVLFGFSTGTSLTQTTSTDGDPSGPNPLPTGCDPTNPCPTN